MFCSCPLFMLICYLYFLHSHTIFWYSFFCCVALVPCSPLCTLNDLVCLLHFLLPLVTGWFSHDSFLRLFLLLCFVYVPTDPLRINLSLRGESRLPFVNNCTVKEMKTSALHQWGSIHLPSEKASDRLCWVCLGWSHFSPQRCALNL